MFAIVEHRNVVTLRILSRPDVSAEEGAQAAGILREVLLGQVLHPESSHYGVILDLRDGPAMFGPRTRQELHKIFARAHEADKRVAVVVGTQTVQRLQFESVQAEAPNDHVEIFDQADAARDFVKGTTSEP